MPDSEATILERSRTVGKSSALQRVVQNGICSGCGMCAGLRPHALQMRVTSRGEYVPTLQPGYRWEDVSQEIGAVCPFSGIGPDEDQLGAREFAQQPTARYSPHLGYHVRIDAAWVTDEALRARSSAGGIGSWLSRHLLRNRIVDGVCCVVPSNAPGTLFEYRIIRREEDLPSAAKSKYYPVELSRVLDDLSKDEGRYAVFALPCYAKAFRLAVEQGLISRDRIHCIIGLFCGHLKTRQFAQYLIRNCGLDERSVHTVDFRKKLPDHPTTDYAFEATTRSRAGHDENRSVRMRAVALGNWGLNGFMLKACECCDDVVAELADVALGDAWLPQFTADGRGANLVITRRSDLADLIDAGVAMGEIAATPVTPSAVIQSQAGAFRQRRESLGYRLYLAQHQGDWRPKKRVSASNRSLRLYSKAIQRLRLEIAARSKNKFLQYQNDPDLKRFTRSLWPLVTCYNLLYRIRKMCVSLRIADRNADHRERKTNPSTGKLR